MRVSYRFPGEEQDLEEFVQPQALMVRDAARRYAHMPPGEQAFQLWDFVCREVAYPLTAKGEYTDYHRMEAFKVADIPFLGPRCRVSRSTEEFFQYPAETLAWRLGDCDCTTILLASLLRTALPPKQVLGALGLFRGLGHAWVIVGDLILETTLTEASGGGQPEVDGAYQPIAVFNDTEAEQVGEVVDGVYYSLDKEAREVGKINRGDRNQEVKKLAKIGELWNKPVKGPK